MPSRILDRENWQRFFDNISKSLGEKQVEIEVQSLSFGQWGARPSTSQRVHHSHATCWNAMPGPG